MLIRRSVTRHNAKGRRFLKTRIRPNWIIGSLFILVFLFLLGLRLGLFQRDGTVRREDHASTIEGRPDREAWMKISQQGQKIGYSHRQYLRTEQGQKIVESIFVQVNTMGMLQEIRVKTEGNFLNDRTLSSFDFEVQSSLFHFTARGVLKGKTLALLTSASGSEQKIEIPLKNEIHLPVDILEVLNDSNLKPGESSTFDVFDPATMSERPVRIVMVSEETIPVLGRMVEAKKVSLDFMGAPQFAWLGRGWHGPEERRDPWGSNWSG